MVSYNKLSYNTKSVINLLSDITKESMIPYIAHFYRFMNYDKIRLKYTEEPFIVIIAKRYYGFGDIINCFKTFKFLHEHFKRVYIRVDNSDDYIFIMNIFQNYNMSLVNIIYGLHSLTMLSSTYNTMNTILIIPAIPSLAIELRTTFKFCGFNGKIKTIYIDEYNGFRINDYQYKLSNKTMESYYSFHDDHYKQLGDENDQYKSEYIMINTTQRLSNFVSYSAGLYATLITYLNVKTYNQHNDSNRTKLFQFEDSDSDSDSDSDDETAFVPALGIHFTSTVGKPTNINELNKLPIDLFSVKCDKILKLTKNYYFAYNSDGYYNSEINYGDLERWLDIIYSVDYGKSINVLIISTTFPLKLQQCNNFKRINENKWQCSNKNITFHIYQPGYFDHKTILYLTLISNDIIFFSGDQSFAEGISMHLHHKTKIIFYQLQPWKMNLVASFTVISQIIVENSDHILNKLLQYIFKLPNEHNITSREIVNMLHNNKKELLKALSCVYDSIHKLYNIERNLCNIIKMISLEDYRSECASRKINESVAIDKSPKIIKKRKQSFSSNLKQSRMKI